MAGLTREEGGGGGGDSKPLPVLLLEGPLQHRYVIAVYFYVCFCLLLVVYKFACAP